MRITRRELAMLPAAAVPVPAAPQTAASEPHLGTLYPLVQKLADSQPRELSFLKPQFNDLAAWKPKARALVLEHLFYWPAPAAPEPQMIRRTDHGPYVEEYLTFATTPEIRVPAFVLVPKGLSKPAPGIVALHDHGGFYFWGKEKLFAQPGEHASLTEFRKRAYGGKSTVVELVRQGYVVVVIDMFYWGERRMVLDSDPAAYRTRPADMPDTDIQAFNRRASQNEQLVARSLLTAGVSWPGIMLWDDMRTVDYLCSRPEVDPKRIGCVGLSVGGYRSFMLAALDERIKAAVDVCWMTSFPPQIRTQVVHTVGLTFHVPGLLRYLDLPDLAALVAPRALLVINGTKDGLFARAGVAAAHDIIRRNYEKAGAFAAQRCALYDTPHEFNPTMQAEAWKWLARWV